jgi:hypothetical protein
MISCVCADLYSLLGVEEFTAGPTKSSVKNSESGVTTAF